MTIRMLGRSVGQVVFYFGTPDVLITTIRGSQMVHIAQVTLCTMAFVVAIVTCLGRELLRTIVLSGLLAICMRILLGIKTQVRAKFSV